MDFYENCPAEVLELIFLHLTEEILELTLISSRANKVISNSVQLMQHCRFEVGERQKRLGTRKYSQLDFVNWSRKWLIPDVPTYLTEVTFDDCGINADVFHALLSKISTALVLLIISDSRFFHDDGEKEEILKWSKQEDLRFPPVMFPKLRTLILSHLYRQSHFFLLSVIRASNLTEFGMERMLSVMENRDSTLVVELIKSNPRIKNLQIPGVATEKFIIEALTHPNVDFNFKELSLSFDRFLGDITPNIFLGMVMDFLKTQKTSLKSLRLANFVITKKHVRRLLSLNLKRLELFCCNVDCPPAMAFKNHTIESLALVFFRDNRTSNFVKLCRFIEKCKNLAAVTVLIDPTGRALPETLAKKSRRIDLEEWLAIDIPWAELRSLKYAGLRFTIDLIKWIPGCLLFHDISEELALEHPYSIMRFEKREFSEAEKISMYKYMFWVQFATNALAAYCLVMIVGLILGLILGLIVYPYISSGLVVDH